MFQNFDILDNKLLDEHQNSEYGTYPNERNVDDYIKHGFILLDKPTGPTSHDIVATVKKILNLSKAGHSGTLDPQVSGVLPIGLEEGTKILTALKGADKKYLCNLKLSEKKDTTYLKTYFSEFTGLIYQYPPLKSNVVRRLRKREIKKIKLLEISEKEILFEVDCEAGTYIRTLCIDLGRAMGTSGFMKELRRTRSSFFEENQCITLHNLFDAYEDYKDGYGDDKIKSVVLPLEKAIDHIPKIIVNNYAVDPICHGAKLSIPGVLGYQDFEKNMLIGLITSKGELICLAKALNSSSAIKNNDEGYIAQPNRVILKRGTYPKYTSQE